MEMIYFFYKFVTCDDIGMLANSLALFVVLLAKSSPNPLPYKWNVQFQFGVKGYFNIAKAVSFIYVEEDGTIVNEIQQLYVITGDE